MSSNYELITGTVTVPRGIWHEVLEFAARRTAEYDSGVQGTAQGSATGAQNGAPATGMSYSVKDLAAATNDRGRIAYRLLATNGGKPVHIDDISKAVGFKGLQTPGLLGSMGRSMWARGFRNALCDASGSWLWPEYGSEFPGGQGSVPPKNVVWGWDGGNRTLTMPTGIAAQFLEALA